MQKLTLFGPISEIQKKNAKVASISEAGMSSSLLFDKNYPKEFSKTKNFLQVIFERNKNIFFVLFGKVKSVFGMFGEGNYRALTAQRLNTP